MPFLRLGNQSGIFHSCWCGLRVFAVLLLLVAVPIDGSDVSAQAQQTEYWVNWSSTFGPQVFVWEGPNGNWTMSAHNYVVPAGQKQVGWIIDVLEFSYAGSQAMADFRLSSIPNNGFGLTSTNPHSGQRFCFLHYVSNSPSWQLLGGAQAQAKCQQLDPSAIWAGWKDVVQPGAMQGMGGWRQAGSSGGMTVAMTPIYYGIPERKAEFIANPYRGPAPLTVDFEDTSVGDIVFWTWAFGDGTGYLTAFKENASPPDHVYTEVGVYPVALTVEFSDGTTDTFETNIIVEDWLELVRPFRADDEGYPPSYAQVPDGVLYEGYVIPGYDVSATNPEHAVVGFSKQSGAPVHTAKEGTVKAILPLQSNYCDVNRAECFVLFAEDPLIFKQFNFLLNGAYKVVVEVSPNEQLHYIVNNPYEYVQVGETIQAGCPLGESIPIVKQYSDIGVIARWVTDLLGNFLALFGGDAVHDIEDQIVPFDVPEGIGFTALMDYRTTPDQTGEGSGIVRRLVSVIAALVEYPEDKPRACAYEPSACVSPDRDLRRQAAWTTSGQADWVDAGGVVIYPASSISVQMALDGMTAYQVEVWAMSALAGSGNLSIQLGQSSASFTTSEGQYSQLLMPATTHTPDLGLEYTFAIRNSGSVPILLKSVCVSSDADAGSGPQSCYFENPSFDGGLNGWQSSEGAVPGLTPGELVMMNNSTISQMATLYPNGAATHQYVVTMTATVGFGSEQDLRADLASKVGFEWEYPAGTGFQPFTAPSSATMYEVGFFFLGYENGLTALPDNQVVFQAYVPVSTMQNSPFTIRAKLDSSNSDIKIRLREACINDPFSHHPGDEWTPPPLQVSCFTIPTPQDNQISTWLFWHWSKLDQFFQCDLMAQLNKMFELSYKTYTLFGWQARYWQSSLLMYTNWLGTDLVPWLDGHFRNMSANDFTVVNTGDDGEGCHDFWCAIVSLSDLLREGFGVFGQLLQLVLMAFSLLFDIVSLLLRLIGGVFDLVLGLINQLFGLVQTISLAWNTAAPRQIPFLPTCEEPQGNALCVGVWFLENTVFGTTFGRLIIPLLLSFAVTEWLEWMFSQIKGLITAIGKVS
jgi:PKD repeat protein